MAMEIKCQRLSAPRASIADGRALEKYSPDSRDDSSGYYQPPLVSIVCRLTLRV